METSPDGGLADPYRIIADLRSQLAERTAERDEALEQQTATAEVLRIINSTPGELAPVFDAMLEKAMRLCDAAFGLMMVSAGDEAPTVAARGVPAAFAEYRRKHPVSTTKGPVFSRLLAGESFVHTIDLKDDDAYRRGDPLRRATVDLGGGRTSLMAALRRDRVVLGAIHIYRQEVRPFTDKQIALLENFAAQAVVAMENARLITETREALEQQTATAEILQVVNSSPGDLGPVFEAMLEKALRLCGASFGSFGTYDGECFHVVASRGHVEFDAWARQRGPVRPEPGTTVGRLVQGERIIQILDIADDEAYRSGASPFRRALVEIGGFRTLLTLALRKDDALLGYLHVYRREVRPFTDKQIALLQNFAAQAVIAMENARLITETREALEQQTATAEVLQVINSSPGDLDPVFDAILGTRRTAFAASSTVASISMMAKCSAGPHSAAFPDKWAERVRHGFRGSENPITKQLLEDINFVHVADLAEINHPMPQAAVEVGGFRTALFLPLRRDNTLLGMIVSARREVRPFSEKEIALLQNFAAQAVIAMENARLITETREALEQQTATAEVLGVINSSPCDLAPVFDAILEKAHTLCGAAHGALMTYDGEFFRAAALHDMAEPLASWLREPVRSAPGDVRERLLQGERLIHIPDIAALEHRNPERQEALDAGVRTLLIVPLRKDGALLGYITANRREVRPFTDKQIALLQNFADQAVIAMENARLLGELRQRTEEVTELNRGLEARVVEQVGELGRVGRLKRFLSPQLAELIVSQGDEKILESHRREIVVVFCDLRGYTAFTETAEPEEVLDFLREYHGALGPLVSQFEGTLDQFSGDGIMVFFNDPVPIPDPAERAVKMAVAMREAASALIAAWRRRDRELGFGVGIAQGYATLGQIGFAERSGYTAIGTVCNLAARLCAEAKGGQILISGRIAAAVEKAVLLEDLGSLALKGLSQPVSAFNVPLMASQPALRVIEGGPQSI